MDKESLKEKFNNKEIFDKMVETTFKNADLNKNSFIESIKKYIWHFRIKSSRRKSNR